MEALCIASQFATFVPLWLITAVLRAMGRDASPEEAEVQLDYLERDGLVACRQMNLDSGFQDSSISTLTTHSWRFTHDLVNDAIRAHIDRHVQRRNRIDWTAIVEPAVCLVELRANFSVEEFIEGLAMWVALATGQKNGVVPVANALRDVTVALAQNSTLKNRLIELIVASRAWISAELTFSEERSHPSFFDALCSLAEAVAYMLPSSLHFNAFGPLIRYGHLIALSGFASGQVPVHSMWEIPESTIPVLARIGKLATEQERHPFEIIPNFDARRRYSHLLMWAGKWTEAGQFMERAVADALDNQEDVCLLSWIHSAACAYLEAQNFKAAQQAYKRGSRELAYQRLGMKHLASLFETNAELILKWSDTQTSSELMKEWRSRFLSGLIETTTFKVAVIGNYPEHGAGSLIADTLETEGLDSQLLYSETVTSFDELPRECGVVILGGYQAHGVEKLVRPWISHKEYSRMVIMESGAPGFGVIEFNASDRVGVWIGSGHHRDTVSATRHWLESGGVQRFIERLRKTTRQVANQQCLTQQDPLQGSRDN